MVQLDSISESCVIAYAYPDRARQGFEKALDGKHETFAQEPP